MPFVEKRLISPTSLTTSASTALYTVPTGYTAIIKQIVVTNTTGTAATFTMYIGAASAGNALFSGTSVAANDTVIINLSQVLGTGEILRALSGTNAALNLTVSGVENDGPLAQNAMYIADNAITSAKIADGAIVNADINASAAIELSKLATSIAGNVIVYNSSGVPTAVAETGDITISDTGVTAIKSNVSLTGAPTAPTATAGTNTTQIATMASRPWNVAWGQVGYVKKTTVTSIVVSPPVTVFSVTFTAVSGRMYKVISELYLQSASTNTYINCAIYNGSTRIQGADYYMSPTINLWHSPTLFTYFSGASGSTTISIQCAMGAGTGQVYADTGGYANALMVEDVGPA
jgi:hypothetical protein